MYIRSDPFITMCLNRIFIVFVCVYRQTDRHTNTHLYWIQKSIFNSKRTPISWTMEMFPILKWHYIWKGFKINGHWKCVNGWSKWGTHTHNNITFSKRHTNFRFFFLRLLFVCAFVLFLEGRFRGCWMRCEH